ncbi:hypothetical protein EJB05_51785 [Eragrostis curvula]|uniref:F-box domain-containing protein n=1 Tax=Eragrostis curvula TaxID=38414 RepID=A0A5J9SUL2_9POAL|nr:hypothetical protein EJB05_51785 [Eragrostis curvula]
MHLPRGSEGPMEDEARQCQGDTVDHQYEDLVLLLPDDAITNVLRRLTPVDLAVSRCVRKAWCEIINDRRLLLPRLIPHAVGGIFIKFNCLDSWEFLARPMAPPSMSCRIDFLPDHKHAMDHCNGLLLMEDYVLNPATGRSAPLPSRPQLPRMGTKYFYHDQYLIFDPTVSLHHEVLVIPRINYHSKEPYYGFNEELDPTIEESEWPPLSCNLLVFSSRTGQWEDRLFCRKGKPMGTVTDMRSASLLEEKRCTVYWQADVYVHCEADFVLRICLSRGKYEVIKPPIDITVSKGSGHYYLGKSEHGVYFALVLNNSSDRSSRLWVWILKDVCCQLEWVLKHQTNLKHVLARQKFGQKRDGPWIFQDFNYFRYNHEDDNEEEEEEEIEDMKFEWDSENDDVLETEDARVDEYKKYIVFLGFHPYKEVVFISEGITRGLAYHLNSSKVQDLGNMIPINYFQQSGHHGFIRKSFVYTPCWIGEIPQ